MVESLPSVSVVIPARGNEPGLVSAVASIEQQDYDNVIEVIVASPAELPFGLMERVQHVPSPSGTTPAGLNAAIAASTGDVVVRCDAHSMLPEAYISNAVAALEETDAANVGGMQVPIGGTFWEKAIAAAMSSPLGAGDARYRIGGEPGPAETVYLGVFRRDALEEVGGFDEGFLRNQDFELNHRLIESGKTVWFDPELRVFYRPRGSLGDLARQYFDYGRWKRHFDRTHPGNLKLRQLAPPLLVVGLILTLLLGFWWSMAWWIPLGYLAALVGAGLFSLPGWKLPALGMPAALATMHLSWGVGFLRGIRRSEPPPPPAS